MTECGITMRISVTFIAALLTLFVLWDAFQTVVLFRRVPRRVRVTRGFYRLLWAPWGIGGQMLPEGNRCAYFRLVPAPPSVDRLPRSEKERLATFLAPVDVRLGSDDASRNSFSELRAMYEHHVEALSSFLLMPLPPWVPPGRRAGPLAHAGVTLTWRSAS
jgi:hypothetical protein